MKLALLILVRANTLEALIADLALLEKLQVDRTDAQVFAHVYLVAVGHKRVGQAKSKIFDWANNHWPAQVAARVECFAPVELAAASPDRDFSIIADYLRGTFLARIIDRGLYQRLHALWRDDWLGSTVAVEGLVAVTEKVTWWLPVRSSAQLDLLPKMPTGFRFRDLFRAPEAAGTDAIIGDSRAAVQLRSELERAARFSAPVLLIGETGTGKELCAKALHDMSGRHGRFVAVNCALLEGQLAESELFGHTKDAYTGASKPRDGRILEAKDGTFFFDELMSMPAAVQAKLLRATNGVEQALVSVTPLGGEHDARRDVDVRVISAVQASIGRDESFRSDLYQRLSWLEITLPPLRTRAGDAALIATQDFERLAKIKEHHQLNVHNEVYAALRDSGFHHWPGNVRELRKVVFRAWHDAVTLNAKEITLAHLEKARGPAVAGRTVAEGDLRAEVDRLVVESADNAMRISPGNKSKAARSLGFNTGQELERYAQTHRDSIAKRGATNA
jgi:DNA-binding NtrC family response regulator